MEGPLGEKSKVPAEEMSAELIISSEKPGLRRRNSRQREHFAATEHQGRRERIRERMKFLQDIVPGCNKVTGRVSVLDETINYVQSLQRQVEFLSFKLAPLNPAGKFNMDALLSKDDGEQAKVRISRTGGVNACLHDLEKEEDEKRKIRRRAQGKAFLKWLFVVLNLVVEVCQATLTQEAAQGKLRHQIYLKLSIATSSFCLVMSLVEAFHEGRSSGVKWRRSGYCGWFYYPGSPGRLFGRFSLYFGIICSMVQLLVNLITKLIGEDFVKFDYVPLLLSACYLVARIIASENKTGFRPVVNCKIHGRNPAKTVDGGETWLCECPKCQEDIS